MVARAATQAVLLIAFVLAGLEGIPIIVQMTGTHATDPLCGRACLPAGVTENPGITLIGE